MIKLKGNISITRIRGGSDKTPVSITIIDEDSSCEAVEICLSLKDFAEALLGMGRVRCDLHFNDSGVIGKIKERKTVEIPRPEGYREDALADTTALACYEVDGWKADRVDYHNPHNWRSNNKVLVQFFRWVDRK